MRNDFGLEAELIEKIVNIVCEHKKVDKIVLFGSRGESDYKSASDIDIAIFDESWDDTDINLVKNILNERVKTPLKFDVLNYYSITKESLRKSIKENGRVIYERTED